MKHLKIYEVFKSDLLGNSMEDDISDILLSLEDKGFACSLSIYGNMIYQIGVSKRKNPSQVHTPYTGSGDVTNITFKLSEVIDTIEFIHNYIGKTPATVTIKWNYPSSNFSYYLLNNIPNEYTYEVTDGEDYIFTETTSDISFLKIEIYNK